MYAKKAKTVKGNTVHICIFEDGETPDDYNNEGFCIACGSSQSGCEPDARRYECEACGLPKVYGLEELVMMGYAKLSDEGGDE
jgi:hypothetical protein